MEIVALLFIIMLVLVIVMVCITPRRRLICFLLGLAFAWDLALLARFEEPLLLLLAPVGAMVSIAALLVEVPAFIVRAIKRRSGDFSQATVARRRAP